MLSFHLAKFKEKKVEVKKPQSFEENLQEIVVFKLLLYYDVIVIVIVIVIAIAIAIALLLLS